MNDWATFSQVELTFVKLDDDETQIRLKQTKLPSGVNPQQLKSGWSEMIFRPMSLLCGFPIQEED